MLIGERWVVNKARWGGGVVPRPIVQDLFQPLRFRLNRFQSLSEYLILSHELLVELFK